MIFIRALFGFALFLTVGIAGLTGCATNPVTGSSDFVLMSEEQEIALGRQYHPQILKEMPRYENAELAAYVQRVGEKLVPRSHRPDLIYRFTLIDSQDVNAFALPGGYIYITRGLLSGDMNAVLGGTVVVGVCFVVLNLLSDILYRFLDPRSK